MQSSSQAHQSSPFLAFSWPLGSQPTLQLNQLVYKHEQSWICGSKPSIYSTKLHADKTLALANQDHHKIQLISGSKSDHWDKLWNKGSSDETPHQQFHPPFKSDPGLVSSSSCACKPLQHWFHHPQQFHHHPINPSHPLILQKLQISSQWFAHCIC